MKSTINVWIICSLIFGNKIVFNNDAESAKMYLRPLDNPSVFSEIRNTILISYLEGCELDD